MKVFAAVVFDEKKFEQIKPLLDEYNDDEKEGWLNLEDVNGTKIAICCEMFKEGGEL